MPTKLSKYKQSIYDIVAENFGTLDYLVKVSNENGFPLSDVLSTGTELIINNEDLGNKLIKEAVVNNGYSFNNNYVSKLLFLTIDTTLITADTTLITADTR